MAVKYFVISLKGDKCASMESAGSGKLYSRSEEALNIITHALGALLSVVALVFLVIRAKEQGGAWHLFSYSVFGGSLLMLYTASTVYHSSKQLAFRRKMRVIDHSAIYVLIAGTYTPFCLITLKGWVGWSIFGFSWAMAVTGVVLKLYFTGKFHRTSTAMYVFMGWIIVFAIKPLVQNLSSEGMFWLVAGGVAYTLGALLFMLDRLKFNHALFHAFVLIGSVSHFIAVYWHLI